MRWRRFAEGGWRTAATAVGAGVLLALSVPPWGWWPLAFVAIAVLDRLLARQPPAARFWRTWGVAVTWLGISTAWMVDFTPPGYVIESTLFAAYYGVAALACPPDAGRRLALPGALTLAELARWSFPFGGVPLSTFAMSQADSPLAPTVRTLGSLLLVAVVATVGVGLSAALDRAWRPVAGAAAFVALAVVGASVAPRGEGGEALEVAVVQGGGPQRTRAEDTDEREVFERHLEASEQVEGPVDLVLWPENVVNIDAPFDETREFDELSDLARELEAPLIVGVVEGFRDRFYNFAAVFDARGELVDRFDKVQRVPFGEYVPLRAVLSELAGDALPARDAVAGDEPAVLDTPVGRLGVVISWEVFFDHRARDAASHGGEVILNPTNGSSYWLTLVQTQQVASSRLRALETGRWVVQAAPTGFSAYITPGGEVHQRTAVSERSVIQDTIELRTGETWATRVGHWPMVVLSLLALALARATSRPWRRRPGDRPPAERSAGPPPP